jgi:hypothetical protein
MKPAVAAIVLLAAFASLALVPTVGAQATLKLAVFASPATIIGWGDETVRIAAQVQDAAGHPICLSQPVTITVASSDLAVLKPYYSPGDERGVIKLGPPHDNSNVGGTWLKWAGAGTTTVTASAPGFESGSARVTVVRPPARMLPPAVLKLYVQPSLVPTARKAREAPGSNNEIASHVVVQLLDANGAPTAAGKGFQLTFTSTDRAVASVGNWFWLDAGTYNSAHLGVGQTPGVTTLSVAGAGLRGDAVRITTFACGTGTTDIARPDATQPPSTQPPPTQLPPTQPPPTTPVTQLPSEITLAAGESWERELPASRTLELFARIAYEKVAGANVPFEVWVNGQRVTSPLVNKRPSFTFADGRSFPYYDASVPGWLLFYSADFTANNTAAGGGYQVSTDAGQAYRYVWDVSSLVGSGRTMRVRLVNNGRAVGRSIIVRLGGTTTVVTPPPTGGTASYVVRKACLVGLYNRWTDCDTGQSSESSDMIPGIGTLRVDGNGKAVTIALAGGMNDYTVEVILSNGTKARLALVGPNGQNIRLLPDGERMGWRIDGTRLVLP